MAFRRKFKRRKASYDTHKMYNANFVMLCEECRTYHYYIDDYAYLQKRPCSVCGGYKFLIYKDRYEARAGEYVNLSIVPEDLFTI